MDVTISPGPLNGKLLAIPSKSHMHRLLICAAFADKETRLVCRSTNQDIEATADCLRALGAKIEKSDNAYIVTPVVKIPEAAVLNCKESGSTLRFLLPVAGALGVDATFVLSGRLPHRPLSPLWEEMCRMGCSLTRPTENTVRCTGSLAPGAYCISGSVSSQFVSGLLFAMALMKGVSQLTITGKLESKPYIQMTQAALQVFGILSDNFVVRGAYPFHSPGCIAAEGDWSNGAFFLAANTLGSNIHIFGLSENSSQGDRVVTQILSRLDSFPIIDGSDIPDLIPILAVVAGAKNGARFQNIERLRLKESDRIASTAEMLRKLGAKVEFSESELTVYPAPYHGCTIDTANDHRIAMSAAIASTVADGPVTVLDARCVEKSYPDFWSEFRKLGGNYVEHIR